MNTQRAEKKFTVLYHRKFFAKAPIQYVRMIIEWIGSVPSSKDFENIEQRKIKGAWLVFVDDVTRLAVVLQSGVQ